MISDEFGAWVVEILDAEMRTESLRQTPLSSLVIASESAHLASKNPSSPLRVIQLAIASNSQLAIASDLPRHCE